MERLGITEAVSLDRDFRVYRYGPGRRMTRPLPRRLYDVAVIRFHAMSMLTVRVPPELEARIGAEARRRRTTRSDLVRRLIEDGLGAAEIGRPNVSCADLMEDLIGCGASQFSDLATNPAHLEAAIVEDYERGRRDLPR